MRVYIAGPYTKGDVVVNVRTAILAADRIFDAGHLPYVPHLTHLWHMVSPRPWQDWMRLDMGWLPTCDALVRLPGESNGAELEVNEARSLCIPVFHGLDAFLGAV